MSSSVKSVLMILAIIFLAVNAGAVLPIVLMVACIYVPYYAIWWVMRGPLPPQPAKRKYVRDYVQDTNPRRTPGAADAATQPGYMAAAASAATVQPGQAAVAAKQPLPQPVAKPAPAAKPKTSRPISLRQWRVAQRAQLAKNSRGSVWSEVTGSWLSSAAVLGVVGGMATLFQVGTGAAWQPMLAGMTWVGLVSLAISWVYT
ncbi:MAG TPA: hypothetical protein DDW52_15900, partial [Planctomycetaceae bacterium]|nr:hypothetical protein [Planctomycetaceae bacterium]